MVYSLGSQVGIEFQSISCRALSRYSFSSLIKTDSCKYLKGHKVIGHKQLLLSLCRALWRILRAKMENFARAKMSLSRAQNIFMPANINSIVILCATLLTQRVSILFYSVILLFYSVIYFILFCILFCSILFYSVSPS